MLSILSKNHILSCLGLLTAYSASCDWSWKLRVYWHWVGVAGVGLKLGASFPLAEAAYSATCGSKLDRGPSKPEVSFPRWAGGCLGGWSESDFKANLSQLSWAGLSLANFSHFVINLIKHNF